MCVLCLSIFLVNCDCHIYSPSSPPSLQPSSVLFNLPHPLKCSQYGVPYDDAVQLTGTTCSVHGLRSRVQRLNQRQEQSMPLNTTTPSRTATTADSDVATTSSRGNTPTSSTTTANSAAAPFSTDFLINRTAASVNKSQKNRPSKKQDQMLWIPSQTGC